MPLVRFEVLNEYGLGQPELYRDANREDPKAVLDGVAVAGLVGILRQLGDLAEFAAEVFHGLQEQVMTTAARSHNLMVRVQNIEAALPPLEKAVLAQTSHLHFAYTAGSEWHPRIKNEQNHFIYNDLPRFIMDSYEECRDPPRLHVLDKFDTGGPGSCLKRYSDPTFFRRVSGTFKEPEVHKDKKARKQKKKRSSQRNGSLLRSMSMSNHSSRIHFSHPIVQDRTSPSHTSSTIDMTVKSDMGDNSNSVDSRPGSSHVECVFHLNSSAPLEEQEYKKLSSQFIHHNNIPAYYEQSGVADDNYLHTSSPEQIDPSSSCVTWDEKAEIAEPKGQHSDEDVALDMMATDSDLDTKERRIDNVQSPDQIDVVFYENNSSKLGPSRNQHEEVESETDNFMDALNTIESESENELDYQTKLEVGQFSFNIIDEGIENGMLEGTSQISDCPPEHESHNVSDMCSNEGLPDDLSEFVPSRKTEDQLGATSPEEISESILSKSIEDEQTANTLPNDISKSAQLRTNDGEDRAITLPNDISQSVPMRMTEDGERTTKDIFQSVPMRMTEDEERTTNDISQSVPMRITEDEERTTKDIFQSVPMRMTEDEERTTNDIFQSVPMRMTEDEERTTKDIFQSVPMRMTEDEERTTNDISQSVPVRMTEDEGRTTSLSHDISKLDSLTSIAGEEKANTLEKSFNPNHLEPKVSANANAFDGSKLVSVANGPISPLSESSNSPKRVEDKTINGSFEPLRPQVQFSPVTPVAFWTNGGLLGLQPSKPPDFAVSKTATQDSVSSSNGITVGAQSSSSMPSSDGGRSKLGEVTSRSVERILSLKSSTSRHEGDDARVESGHPNDVISSSQAHQRVLNHKSVMMSGSDLPLDEDEKGTSTDAKQENGNNSSKLFGLGHRLLANGFHRKMSLGPDSNTELASSLKACVLEQKPADQSFNNQATVQKESSGQFGNRSIEPLGHRSLVDSVTSSPPLEHMKISFHPMVGYEVSKLKLKFSDGSHCDASVGDTFPSFQLVPEPAVSLHDVGSDSDDDTFCRSSPYISDDYPSQHSESDSEQWESGETPGNKGHDAGTNATHVDAGLMSLLADNAPDPSLSAPLLDFPSFDSMSPALQGEAKDNSDQKNLQRSQHSRDSTPLPPPLPPMQWRVLHPHLDMAEDQQHFISEAHKNAFDLELLGATLSQQEIAAPAKGKQNNGETILVKRKSELQDQPKLSRQTEAKQPADLNEMDEKEDFLHQIRAKSFTLRRTVTAKPTFASGRTASEKVTAILEKANAIRQAVGSDDGESDNWSDT